MLHDLGLLGKIFLLLPFGLFAQALVFVHLGPKIPLSLPTCIKQARFLNEDWDIYLLADKTAYPILQEQYGLLLRDHRIELVNGDQIAPSKQRQTFYAIHPLDASIASGLWVYASERFFFLYDFIRERNLSQVFHLESDTMLYVDLDELLPRFEGVRLAAPFQSYVGCIPCFCFIQDSESLGFLIEHMLSEMAQFKGKYSHIQINDMQTLASFYKQFKENYLMPLPTLPADYSEPKQKSTFGRDNQTPLKFLTLNTERFPNYLFDAAGLGIFFNGNNREYSPKNGPGTFHSRCLFNPRTFSYFWGKDAKNRTVPYLEYKGKNYRIVNLHFHSKMPEDYASFSEIPGVFPKGPSNIKSKRFELILDGP